ncbi:hypothetical protein SPRG_13010 [Saprolegnia parasitica CBS 223.65]|uniref:Uncharacterized protein n=1 Tax=Saprolegnia parasitica (strain CBS 223.65) TaxID=695850 RepID=A0A067C4H8_SAPPC|nr:hypothetical protein SPRG_13010 [Saprolegnia parasitica CBS 223.65]KDO21672.1 hypothetical protein SPRG_13010 [Saprolegnia parasitica CBS 223.65]|eukprot:XP_012207596.1 hypothetical protein SPRG_13010 [Saprolegnia parasitica CBS 223.65]
MGNFATKPTASSDNVQWMECHNAVTAFVATTTSAPTMHKHCLALDSALRTSATAAQWCARVVTCTCTFIANRDDDDARWKLVDCLQEAPGAFEATDVAFKYSLETLRGMRECIVQCHQEQHADTSMPLSSHIEVDACTNLAIYGTYAIDEG